jgi:WD40 repeat protein
VFSPDGRCFATASFDGTARVWETATGRPAGPALQHTNYVATVAFSPDGATLAAGDFGPFGLIKLWDWRTGNEVRPPLRHDDIILSVSFSPDGRYLAAIKAPDWSKIPQFLVWEVASGRAVIRVRQTWPSYLTRETARFRPDSRAVTIRDVNGVLRLWEVPSGKLLGERSLDGDGMTRFSPDGRVIAATANLGVRLLDGDNLKALKAGYLPHPDAITDLAFSPDGAFLLVGYESGSAQLWDVATRQPVGPPAVLIGAIRAVTFTQGGKTCVCVAADGTVRRWPVPAPFVEPDLARLADRVALMTGQRMGDNPGLESVPPDEWRALRAKLVGEGSTALVPPRQDADWHDARAADAEQDRDAYGAEWHLDRLAAIRPNDWNIPARRGRALAADGRKDEAAAAYAIATRKAPSPQVLSDWLRAAAEDNEAAGRKEAALWNRDRAVKLTPGAERLPPTILLKGMLTREDPLDSFGPTQKSFHKVHLVPLESGKPYLIDLEGTFDTFLRIEDADKKCLLFNDDVSPPDNLNSRLVFIPSKKGTYRLIVTSFQPQATGSYTVAVRDAAKVGDAPVFKGRLDKMEPVPKGGRFIKIHKLELVGGSPCTLELTSPDFAAAVVLVHPPAKVWRKRPRCPATRHGWTLPRPPPAVSSSW